MRVCVDLTPLEMLDRHGGFGRYGLYLLRELVALGEHDAEIVAVLSSRGPVLAAREALERAATLGPEIRSVRHRMQRRLMLGSVLRAARLDLFHAIVPTAQPLVPGCKAVVTAHDLIPVVHPERGVGMRYRVMSRRLLHWQRYARADHVIAISDQTRRDLIDELHIAPGRITVVPHGVDAAHFNMDAPARPLHDVPEKYLLCVSSDHYRKNHRVLLDAWCRVADRIAEGLVFVGRALYEETFTAMARDVEARGLAERFRWLDSATDDELPALYRGATACVAPSRYEGFGMTLLEAMACGTPVIAASNGAYEEVGTHAALFFPTDDADALAALLLRITSDPTLRADLRRQGLARASAMSWRSTAAATLEVYRRVCGEA